MSSVLGRILVPRFNFRSQTTVTKIALPTKKPYIHIIISGNRIFQMGWNNIAAVLFDYYSVPGRGEIFAR